MKSVCHFRLSPCFNNFVSISHIHASKQWEPSVWLPGTKSSERARVQEVHLHPPSAILAHLALPTVLKLNDYK